MDVYLVGILVTILIFGLLAVSLDLLLGWAGLFTIAHAATFGVGAYASALVAQWAGLGFWPGLAAAILATASLGALIALPALRVSGDYLVLGSFAVQETLHGLALNLDDVTGGPAGLRRIPRPSLFGFTITDPLHYLALYAAIAALILLLLRRLLRSPFGLLLRAIREDEIVPQALGKSVPTIKVTAFALSGAVAGVAGSLYAHYVTFISPESFDVNASIFVLSMVLIGGMGTLWGGLAGAALLIALPEVLRFLPLPTGMLGPGRQVVYGLVLIGFCFLRPSGLVVRR